MPSTRNGLRLDHRSSRGAGPIHNLFEVAGGIRPFTQGSRADSAATLGYVPLSFQDKKEPCNQTDTDPQGNED